MVIPDTAEALLGTAVVAPLGMAAAGPDLAASRPRLLDLLLAQIPSEC